MDVAPARMPILGPLAATAFLGGAVVCLFFAGPMPRLASWVCIALGLIVWCAPWRFRTSGALICGMALVSLHIHSVREAWLPPELEGKALHLSGRVADLPRQEEDSQSFLFEVAEDAAVAPLRGRVIRLGWYAKPGESMPRVHAGSTGRLTVKLKRPHSLRNPGVLDSERTAFANRVVATGSIVGNATWSVPGPGIESARDALGLSIEATGAPASRFIRALAVGDTRAITDADWKILRADGLTHLIAISGSHVAMAGLVGVFLAWLLWRAFPSLGVWLPRRVAAPALGACVAIGYTFLAGGEVPTVRTLLMMWCVAGALVLRRRLGVAHALSAAAITLVWVDPLSLLRPGFWLSFGGVAWLAWSLQGVKQGRLGELWSSQMVATIGLLPLCILFFGQTSWVAPLANLIAVPLWGLVVVPLSIAGVGLNAVYPDAAQACWKAAAWLFDLAWPVFQHLATWPGAQINVGEATPWAVLLALAGAFWLLMPRGVPMRWAAVMLFLPLVAPAVPRAVDAGMAITVIDVGQGLSIVVQTRTHTLLYDAGPKSRTGIDAGEKTVLPALAALGIRQLDLLMLSHGDADHAGGLEAVTAAFPKVPVQAPPGTPVVHGQDCSVGEAWTWDDVHFEVLAPVAEMAYAGNGSSCVLKITSRFGSALLTGDIEAEGEAGLLARNRAELAADVVTMPHHGSRSSSSYPFVRAVRAKYAVASSGYRNMFKHPRAQVWERWQAAGTQPLNTVAEGAVRFGFNADGIEVVRERLRRHRAWDTMVGEGVNGGSGLSYGHTGGFARDSMR